MNVTLLSKKDKTEKNGIEHTHNFSLIFKNTRVGNNTEMESARPRGDSRWRSSGGDRFFLLVLTAVFPLINTINDIFFFMLSVFLISLQINMYYFYNLGKNIILKLTFPVYLTWSEETFSMGRQNSKQSTK